MKICAGLFGKYLFIIVRAWCMAINYALKILCRSGNLIASLIVFSWLYMP